MKDETSSDGIEELVGLKPKMFFCVDGSVGYKAYDMNKNVVEYKNFLLNN